MFGWFRDDDLASKRKEYGRFLNLQFSDSFWRSFFEELTITADRLWESTKIKKFNEAESYWEQVEVWVRKLLSEGFTPIPHGADDPPLDLIVCIDEARNFQKLPSGCKWDLLMQMNRAARLLPAGSVFVFMDTLSDLNVMYPEKAFPSDRSKLMGLKNFVYTSILTWDLGYKVKPERAARNIFESAETKFMALYGRPLWTAMLETGTGGEDIMAVAESKLTCLRKLGKKLEPLGLLALIATRVNLDIHPRFCSTPELIGSFIAHVDCYRHEETGYAIDVSYPSDPIVSMASTRRLANSPEFWVEGLKVLKSCVKAESVGNGERGELVSQLVCTYAADLAFKATPRSGDASFPCLKVEDFLVELMGKKLYKEFLKLPSTEEKDIDAVLNGYINFNQFIKVSKYVPQRRDLVEFLHHRAAVVCKNCQVGADLIIPVILARPHEGEPSKKTRVNYGKREPSSFKCKFAPGNSLISAEDSQKITKIAEILKSMDDVAGGPIELDNIRAASRTRSHAPASSSSPVRGMHRQQEREDEYLMDEQYVSYILIDSKNYQSSRLPSVLENLNPLAAGIERQSSKRSKVSTVPYLAIAMYYDDKKVHRIKEMPTYKEGQTEPDNFASVALYNPHMNLKFPKVISNELAEFLRPTDVIDLASEGEERLTGCMQLFGIRGTDFDKWPVTLADIKADCSGSVSVNRKTLGKRRKL